jgi:hypothetical protein
LLRIIRPEVLLNTHSCRAQGRIAALDATIANSGEYECEERHTILMKRAADSPPQ